MSIAPSSSNRFAPSRFLLGSLLAEVSHALLRSTDIAVAQDRSHRPLWHPYAEEAPRTLPLQKKRILLCFLGVSLVTFSQSPQDQDLPLRHRSALTAFGVKAPSARCPTNLVRTHVTRHPLSHFVLLATPVVLTDPPVLHSFPQCLDQSLDDLAHRARVSIPEHRAPGSGAVSWLFHPRSAFKYACPSHLHVLVHHGDFRFGSKSRSPTSPKHELHGLSLQHWCLHASWSDTLRTS